MVVFPWARRSGTLGLAVGWLALAYACSGVRAEGESPPSGASDEDAATPLESSRENGASSGERAADPGSANPPSGKRPRDGWPPPTTCAALPCFAFDSPAAALSALLRAENPRVLGFGEAHAPAGFTGKPTVRRFAEELLPTLAPQASSLVVELLAPASGCAQAEASAREQSEAITTGQAESNQSDYLKLGHAARALSVTPDILRASCADLEAIRAAGDEGVLVILETIARLTVETTRRELTQTKEGRPLVLAYGGALHNDVSPRPGRESWSYAAALRELTGGRYLELDLVVPELARDTESWRAFRWYEAFRAVDAQSHETWLIESAPGSYALVFPRAEAPAAPSAP